MNPSSPLTTNSPIIGFASGVSPAPPPGTPRTEMSILPNSIILRGNFIISNHVQPNCRMVWSKPCSFGRSIHLEACRSLAVITKGKSRQWANHPTPDDYSWPPQRNTAKNTEFTRTVGIDSTIEARYANHHQSQSKQN
ncbi:unnamed protein product [Prunus armeniaca]